jgi:hypothetical protein
MLQKVANNRHKAGFWALLTFLPTFFIARLLVYYFEPEIFVYIGGVRIHHMFWGISLLAIAGYLALEVENPRHRLFIGALYGAGLALTFDEFGMWLYLDADYYWVHDFYEPAVIILFVLINSVFFSDLWNDYLKRLFGMKK